MEADLEAMLEAVLEAVSYSLSRTRTAMTMQWTGYRRKASMSFVLHSYVEASWSEMI
jgi:hypothetical protein